jgi:hypothetical protein
MDDKPERIWATGNYETGSWNAIEGRMKSHMPDGWQTEYVRADLATDLVRAALERAAETSKEIADQYVGYMSRVEQAIRAIAKDDEAVEAIITSVVGEPT